MAMTGSANTIKGDLRLDVRGDLGGQRGADEASQAILLAELQMVRNLLAEASAVMSEQAAGAVGTEEELFRCREELSVVRQSWQASEMSLKVQSESVERLTNQIQQLSEELRQVRSHESQPMRCREWLNRA